MSWQVNNALDRANHPITGVDTLQTNTYKDASHGLGSCMKQSGWNGKFGKYQA